MSEICYSVKKSGMYNVFASLGNEKRAETCGTFASISVGTRIVLLLLTPIILFHRSELTGLIMIAEISDFEHLYAWPRHSSSG
jgi:hypothetical protein